MVWSSKKEYSALTQVTGDSRPSASEDVEAGDPFLSADGREGQANLKAPVLRGKYLLTAGNIVVFLFSLAMFVGASWPRSHGTSNQKVRQANAYNLEPSLQQLNGSLFPSQYPSIARQMPNAAADAIWEEWELTRVFPVTRQQIIEMGKDPSTAAKLEDELWGLSDDAYAAILDVYHQLHCLNSLRQIAYGNYYDRIMGDVNNITFREIHINHCVDMLMQTIQCSGNVGLITMHWVETQEYPFPDMSLQKQCVNFEKLTDWRLASTIDMDRYVEVMRKPEGVTQRKMADQYYAYHGWPNPNHRNGAFPGEDFNV